MRGGETKVERKRLFYDPKHDISYHFDSENVEIILGEKTRREKDIETMTLPIESLSNFTCGVDGKELVRLADESSRGANEENIADHNGLKEKEE